MYRLGNIAHLLAATGFVASGLAYSVQPRSYLVESLPGQIPSFSRFPLLSDSVLIAQDALQLPKLYLQPQNLVMWLLLIALWAMLLMDAVGQAVNPSDGAPPQGLRKRRGRVWPALVATLLAGMVWFLLLDRTLAWAAAGAVLMLATALFTATRSGGRSRPAIGFLAGWSTGVAMAALAGVIGRQFGLTVGEASILAILPGAVIGSAAQAWIGHSISYSAALIWAFCALTLTTMGSNPMIAVSSILGIAIMAIALIRAAS